MNAGVPNPKFSQQIQKDINYPEFSKKIQEEGVVVILFKLNPDGNIVVIDSQSNSETLKNHVINKIENISYKETLVVGEEYLMRFVFLLN